MGHTQRSRTRGIAQGSILGPVLCKVISDPVLERTVGTGAHSDQTGRGHSLGNIGDILEDRAATQTALERLEEGDNGNGNSAVKNAKCCTWEGRAAANRNDWGLSAWGTALLKRAWGPAGQVLS